MTNRNLEFLTKTTALKVGFIPMLALSNLIICSSAQAGILNTGFENGLANWIPTGDVSIDTGTVGSSPLFGNSQALLTTGTGSATTGSPSTLEDALGLATGELDISSPFLQAFEGSAIVQTFTVEEGETISLNWNFLTDDSNSPFPFTLGSPRDYAFVVVDGVVTTLADTSSSLVPSSTSFNQETGFQLFTSNPLSAGVHTIGFGVVDIQDNAVDSALLIDAPQDTSISTPEPTSSLGLLLLCTLTAGGLLKRRS